MTTSKEKQIFLADTHEDKSLEIPIQNYVNSSKNSSNSLDIKLSEFLEKHCPVVLKEESPETVKQNSPQDVLKQFAEESEGSLRNYTEGSDCILRNAEGSDDSLRNYAEVSDGSLINYAEESDCENVHSVPPECKDNRSPPSGKVQSPDPYNDLIHWNKRYLEDNEPLLVDGAGESKYIYEEERFPANLEQLLSDGESTKIFYKFINESYPHTYHWLNFWFACTGLEQDDSVDLDLVACIQTIWDSYFRKFKIPVSRVVYEWTKEEIKLGRYRRDIFNDAKIDVVFELKRLVWVPFTCSSLFLSWTGVDKGSLCMPYSEVLPTVHEDSVFDKEGSSFDFSIVSKSRPLVPYDYNERFVKNSGPDSSLYQYGCVYGNAASLRESERSSIGSRSNSYKSGSLEGSSRHNYSQDFRRARYYAQCNTESANLASALLAKTQSVVPRTMLDPHAGKRMPKGEEFVNQVSEKLQDFLQEREIKDKVTESMRKISEDENTNEDLRKQHAENSLPPVLLFEKLDKLDADEKESEDILDQHISMWEKREKDRPIGQQMPNLNYPTEQQNLSFDNFTQAKTPYLLRGESSHIQRYMLPSSHAESWRKPRSMIQMNPDSNKHINEKWMRIQPKMPALINPYYSQRNSPYIERGNDVISTLSSDSGTVDDYNIAKCSMPKSNSMPHCMQNYAVRHGNMYPRRRSGQVDLTDSGVSVISDSGRSSAAFPEYDRMSFTSGRKSQSSSSGMSFSSGRRSQSSSSVSAKTCITAPTPIIKSNSDCIHPFAPSPEFERQLTGSTIPYFLRTMSDDSVYKSSQQKTQRSEDVSLCRQKSTGDTSTKIVYSFYRKDEVLLPSKEVPFLSRVDSLEVTLKQFKQLLRRKGNYRYYFQQYVDDDYYWVEITDDNEQLPQLGNGKIMSKIEILKDE